MRVRIGVPADLGEGVERVLGLAVVAEGAVALMNLLELAQGVGLGAGVPPHLLALHEEGVPVINPRINCQ
jgi:hypothetical protein